MVQLCGFSYPGHDLLSQVVLSEVCFGVSSSRSMLFRCLLGFVVYGVVAFFVGGGGFLLLYVLLSGMGFDLAYGDGVWLAIVGLPEVFP